MAHPISLRSNPALASSRSLPSASLPPAACVVLETIHFHQELIQRHPSTPAVDPLKDSMDPASMRIPFVGPDLFAPDPKRALSLRLFDSIGHWR